MKKRIGLILAGAMLAMSTQVFGATQVNWNTLANTLYVVNGGTTNLLPASSLFLAFSTTNGVNTGFNPATPSVPAAGTFYLGAYSISGAITSAGRITSGAQTYTDAEVGRQVFLVAFNMLYASYGGGSLAAVPYKAGPLSTPLQQIPPGSAFLENTVITAANPLRIIVPEPATGMFVLAGLGVLAYRRMRQRNG